MRDFQYIVEKESQDHKGRSQYPENIHQAFPQPESAWTRLSLDYLASRNGGGAPLEPPSDRGAKVLSAVSDLVQECSRCDSEGGRALAHQ